MDFGGPATTATLKEIGGGRITGGLLTATRALNSPSSADLAGLGAIISANVDLGDVTVTRGHAVQTGNGNQSIERYYDISPSKNNSNLDATLTHTYADAELNGLSESELLLFKSTDGGTTWTGKGADSRDTNANTVSFSGIGSFSRWTLGASSSPLPVELATFGATRIETGGSQKAIRLSWRTAAETGNAGFVVQRRAVGSGVSWQEVGYQESKANGGSTSEPKSYQFVDGNLPYAADTLEYRLRQVDVSGATTLSDPIRVARGGVSEPQIKETYPNPASERVTVRYAVPDSRRDKAQEATLQLYDVLGRRVATVETVAEPGRHKTWLSVQDLASGAYLLRLEVRGQTRTRRLTVVK